MAAIFAFKCDTCGEVHEGSPSIALLAPDPYLGLSDAQKNTIATMDEDLCIINYGERSDYFVRAVLEVPIHGVEEPFLWGVWVSASEKSFHRYAEILNGATAAVEGDGFFGWVCNQISVYPYGHRRAADVFLQPEGNRPKAMLHRSENDVDPLVIDQVHGISIRRAQELAEKAMHGHD